MLIPRVIIDDTVGFLVNVDDRYSTRVCHFQHATSISNDTVNDAVAAIWQRYRTVPSFGTENQFIKRSLAARGDSRWRHVSKYLRDLTKKPSS